MKPIGVLSNSTKRVDAFRLVEFCFSLSFLFICIGTLGVSLAFWKLLAAKPGSTILAAAAGAGFAMGVVWLGLKVSSRTAFLGYIAVFWALSRGLMVLLFPRYVPPGDEAFFHTFVGKLVSALLGGTVASLSNIYDYPVWISRAFPLYLPLAELFKSNDLVAARWMNVVLGAGQLVVLYFVAEILAGSRVARLTCLLFLLFPYHWVNVLSYDPQIAGTFFLLIAVWMFVVLLRPRERSRVFTALLGLGLGLSLFFAGIQRGGIDILFVAVILGSICVYDLRRRSLLSLAVAVVVIWLPARIAFSHWIDSYDAHHLRSHALGFMTRGWNLETSGEYLPLYEQLDVVSPKTEKKRILEAVLVTEFARQPVRSLLVLPFIKIAKLFAIGYASTAEVGLEEGGYSEAVSLYRVLRSIYAPLILMLSAYGILCCLGRQRFALPVLLITLSCLGIVLLWETSPRYSHPLHFAILMFAAFGITCLSAKKVALKAAAGRLALQGLIAACCWIALSIVIVVICRAWKSYQFVDPRSLDVRIGETRAQLLPISPVTQSWEDGITVPAGTPLPASIYINLPADSVAHLWQITGANYQIQSVPPSGSGHIARLVTGRGRGLVLHLSATDGSNVVRPGFEIGFGFLLRE